MRNSNVNATMLRWRVGYLARRASTFGTVDASDEKSAIGALMKTFHVSPARRFKITATKTDASDE